MCFKWAVSLYHLRVLVHRTDPDLPQSSVVHVSTTAHLSGRLGPIVRPGVLYGVRWFSNPTRIDVGF